ncbi:MAG: TetR/AcrR family transcriptional regulator [Sphingobacteriaceae bacterium]|nr:TetR/AcrR family transcriptional regulator [Sphingobacteriaceae bacterium]
MLSKAERTRQFIIEKTAPIFNSKGYSGTSLNDIIDATGLTKGAIYGNFDNKDEVALAAFEYNFGNITNYIAIRIRERESAIQKLLVYPETHRQILKLPFLKGGCPVLNTSVDADDTHPMLKEKAINALNLWRSSVVRIINTGIQTKEIKKNTNATEFAAILVSITEGAVMQAKVSGKPTELNISMDFLEKMIHELKN